MESILQAADCRVQGFLAAGHVCTIAGFTSYEELAARYEVPIVVTGFEPVDLLLGIQDCVGQLESGTASVSNQYQRNVRDAGNRHAMQIMSDVYAVADRPWRGLGTIPSGGVVLRPEWRQFDAEYRFPRPAPTLSVECADCRSGDVLAGRIKPTACISFGTRCTPESPLGAPMVSSEGACAAYYRHLPKSGTHAVSITNTGR